MLPVDRGLQPAQHFSYSLNRSPNGGVRQQWGTLVDLFRFVIDSRHSRSIHHMAGRGTLLAQPSHSGALPLMNVSADDHHADVDDVQNEKTWVKLPVTSIETFRAAYRTGQKNFPGFAHNKNTCKKRYKKRGIFAVTLYPGRVTNIDQENLSGIPGNFHWGFQGSISNAPKSLFRVSLSHTIKKNMIETIQKVCYFAVTLHSLNPERVTNIDQRIWVDLKQNKAHQRCWRGWFRRCKGCKTSRKRSPWRRPCRGGTGVAQRWILSSCTPLALPQL